MIKKVEMVGFKGCTGEFELTGKDIFVGKNGSGKTRIIEAIEFAIKGAIGKNTQNKDVYAEYGCGPVMTVTLTCEDFDIKRRIKPTTKKDGSVSYSGSVYIYVDGREKHKGKEVEEFLKNHFSPIAFDYSDFLKSNSSDRRKTLIELVGYSQPSKEEIAEVAKEVENKSIDDAIAYATDETKYWNRKQRESSGASAYNTSAKNELQGNVRNIAKLEESLKEYDEQLQVLKNEKNTAEIIMRQKQHDNQELDVLKKQLQDLMALDYEQAIKETQKQISECGPLKELEQPIIDDIISCAEKINAQEKKIDAYDSEIDKKNFTLSYETRELELTQEMIERISNFNGVCPIAGVKCTSDLSEGLETYQKKLEDIDNRIGMESDILKQLEEKKQVEVDALDALRKDHDELTNRNADITLHNKQKTQYNELCIERKEVLEKELADLNNDIKTLDSNIKAKRDQIKSLEQRAYEPYQPLEEIEPMILGLEKNIEETKQEIEAIKEKQNAIKLQQKAIAEHEQDKAQWEIWKDIKKQLALLKLQKMKERLAPIEASVNDVLQQAGHNEKFEFITSDANGNEIISFGLFGKDTKVALSSGEHTLISIGMLKALQPNQKLLFIDEILLFDDDNLSFLLNNDLDFDNVILLTPHDVESDIYEINHL